MSEPENRLRNIFAEALEIDDLRKRQAYLAQACAGDQALRAELDALLQADGAAGDFLPEKPGTTGAREALAQASAMTTSPAKQIGDRIAHYKLLEKIGEGGCGIVYLAEQEAPVRRRVALKVIKLGMDTREVIARFEAERQALAMMNHPNIAKVFDAGATETGRPYFVMELVRGIKITTYCDEHRFSTRDRLELFIQVCQAVQHAHQKGIIHRDIKPSNILVTSEDPDLSPCPKVIDFGIAKATIGRLTDQTLFTAFEQFLGTPAYMSPEQAAMTNLDIDTRSDIYSLGVLLYELLTGRTPFDTKSLLASGLDELRRTIRDKEPVRPSTCLRHITGQELTITATYRQTDAGKLIHLLGGDLDWIVMKCLEKDRTRRYETANGLAKDIQRHLNSEPVLARPPSRLYEFEKTVKRHKVGFGAATIVMLALAAGTIISSLEAVRAKKAERQQGVLRLKATEKEQLAEQEAQKARLAEADAKEKLWGSYLAQAQAGRWSRRAGRRFEGLELLRKAAEIRPSLLELRNEAIACMALPDLRVIKEIKNLPFQAPAAVDSIHSRYTYADVGGTLHVCRIEDSVELMQFSGYAPPFRAFDLSPDGRLLFLDSGKDGYRVEILDLEQKRVVFRLTEPHYRTMSFTHDSELVAISYGRKDDNWPIHIFDLASGKKMGSFGHGTFPRLIRFHPSKPNLLLTTDETQEVRLWDWTNGKVVRSFSHPEGEGVIGIAWSREGDVFASGCADNLVYLWEPETGNHSVLAGHEGVPVEISFAPGDEFLISVGWDGQVRIWDPTAKRELFNMAVTGSVGFRSAAMLHLWMTEGPRAGRLMQLEAGQGYSTLRSRLAPQESCVMCDFSPDGHFIAGADSTGMKLWDISSGREVESTTETNHTSHLAFFHPDGTNIFLASSKGIENWAFQVSNRAKEPTLALLRVWPLEFIYNSMRISADGQTLAVGSRDGLHLIDLTTWRETAQLKPPYGEVFAAISRNGSLAATWTRLSTNILIWDTGRSNIVQTLTAADISVQVAFSPNDRLLAIGDGTQYRMYDRATWKGLYVVPRSASFWAYMGFSPDGKVLGIAASRSTLRLIESATGRELATLEAPQPAGINWISFSHDGSQVAAATEAGPIQVWDLRVIRKELGAMNLDWELAPQPTDNKK